MNKSRFAFSFRFGFQMTAGLWQCSAAAAAAATVARLPLLLLLLLGGYSAGENITTQPLVGYSTGETVTTPPLGDYTTERGVTSEPQNISVTPKAMGSLLKAVSGRFAIVVPPSDVAISDGIMSEKLTERFVYAPQGVRLTIPCSTQMKSLAPFANFYWTSGGSTIAITDSAQGRMRQTNNKELMFEVTEKADTGIYNCSAIINGQQYNNGVELRVFSVAGVAVGFPLKFRAIQCNKDEESSIVHQANEILCPSLKGTICNYDLSSTCAATPWYQQTTVSLYPSLVQVIAIRYPTKTFHETNECQGRCVLEIGLQSLLSEISSDSGSLRSVYNQTPKLTQCSEPSCAKGYYFELMPSLGDITLLYTCEPGFVLYRKSSCVPCLPGKFAPRRGPNEDCTECPVDSYQPLAGNSSCIACNMTLRRNNSTAPRTGGTSIEACGVVNVSLVRLILFIAAIVLTTLVLIIVILCVIYREGIAKYCGRKKMAKDVYKQDGRRGEKVPLVVDKAPSRGPPPTPSRPPPPRAAASAAAPAVQPKSHPPPAAHVAPAAASAAKPKAAEAGTGAAVAAAAAAAPRRPSQEADAAPVTVTPITVSPNAKPADIIKKAIEKVAPDMKLQSLKITTGTETNTLTLPTNYYDPDGKTAPTAAEAQPSPAAAAAPPPPAPPPPAPAPVAPATVVPASSPAQSEKTGTSRQTSLSGLDKKASTLAGPVSSAAAVTVTPITVSPNAKPADIIKKAIEKVAPDMKLQSLKITTGTETNTLTLPTNYYEPGKTASQILPPTVTATPSHSAVTTASAPTPSH